MSRARSEGRLTALGTGNWNNRGIDNHIKRPAGCSSAGLKRMGNKRIDDVPNASGRGNTSHKMVDSLKYPDECLVSNEHVYDAGCVRHFADANFDPFDANHRPAGVEAAKTVQYLNYQALSDPERDGPEGGKPPSWLVGQKLKRQVTLYAGNGDPVKHDYVMPHKPQTRPMRRMGPSGNSGPVYDNGAARLNWNLQHQQLHTGPLNHKDMTAGDWKAVGQRLQVSAVGEVMYNVGGKEDLRPACTLEYAKADKPVSRMTQYENDRRQLLRHDRVLEQHGPSIRNRQSPDMIATMCGRGDSTPSAAASCLDDATCAPSEYSRDPARELRPAVPQPRSYVESQASRDSRASPGSQSFSGRRPQSARGPDRRSQTASSIVSSYLGPEGSEAPSWQVASERSCYSGSNRQVKERASNQAPKGSGSKPSARSSGRQSPRAPGGRPQTAR